MSLRFKRLMKERRGYLAQTFSMQLHTEGGKLFDRKHRFHHAPELLVMRLRHRVGLSLWKVVHDVNAV